ncbi:unnamed protein product [Citrullus colocynthis]|uniref:Leucine-rich repeat-containing N-terminal plant-type domain-containing protein n=1 Tax=Citrullus colocynthis TaxID=252529 RepID=A0ABP0Z637_9ROSI
MKSITFVWLFCLLLSKTVGAYTSNNCSSNEREALIAFKKGLSDPSARLSSWLGDNCCEWHGITCNLISGKVTKIDLHNSLGSTISPFLAFGDDYRPWIDPEGAPIPYFFGMLRSLRLPLYVENLQWLSGLSSLEYLNLGWSFNTYNMRDNKFQGTIPHDFLQNLCKLRFLDLGLNRSKVKLEEFLDSFSNCSRNSLESLDLAVWIQTQTQLTIIVLSNVGISGSLPNEWISKNCSLLRSIDLSGNRFLYGKLPSWIGVAMPELRLLNLRSNRFSGTIPRQWCNLHFLRIFDLSNNRLSGKVPNYNKARPIGYSELVSTIPENIGAMQKLETLDLSSNHLTGRIPASLASLNFLSHLNISFNNLTGRIRRGNQLQTLPIAILPYVGLLYRSTVQVMTVQTLFLNQQARMKMAEVLGFYISMAIGFPVGINILFFTIFTN